MDKKTVTWLVFVVLLVSWVGFSCYRYTNQVEIVKVEGPIYDFQKTVSDLSDALNNPNVKAVVLYLNTPGGLAYPCMEIAEYVKTVSEVKPVIVVMGSECASGGYYIASFATKIFTHKNTLTGGIGVLAVWVDLTQYYEKQGIKVWVWSTSKEKDFGAPWRSPTEEEKAAIQNEVNRIFDKILQDIKNNRNLSSSAVEKVKSGRIFYGDEAISLGLADDIGDLHTAIKEAAKMAGLTWYITVPSNMDVKLRFLRAMWLL